jgi:hypothetical protein
MRKRSSTTQAALPDGGRILQSMIDTVRLGESTIRTSGLPVCEPHHIEQEVQRRLLSEPELRFASLVIRRTPQGVCLEGVLETDDGTPDVCALARSVAGVEEVLNHLVVRRPVAQA